MLAIRSYRHHELPAADNLQTFMQALGPHNHLCLIYETRQEWKEAIIPYVLNGIEKGEKCFYVADTSTAQEIRALLKEAGLEIDRIERTGQFTVFNENEVYTREGFFDPGVLIGLMIEATEEALNQGYTALRFTGEMSWALKGNFGTDKLLEYEARLNRDFFPRYPCTAVCQYNRNLFNPDVIKDVILTHPLLIWGGRVYRNFYYIEPELYLNSRKSGREVERWLNNLEKERRDREELEIGQQRLLEGRERYRKLAESAGAILWEFDIQGDRWTYVSPQVESILGYSPDQWFDLKFWTDRIHPEDRQWATEYCRECTSRGEDHIFEYRFIKKDGSVAWLHDDVTVELKAGKPVKMRGFMIDITERKKEEQSLRDFNRELERKVKERTAELEAVNRELEAFTYSVSHDLRAPLRTIDGFSRIVLEDYGEKLDHEGRRLLQVIHDNTRQMDQLITDLLLLSRSTRKELNKTGVDMAALARAGFAEAAPPGAGDDLVLQANSMPPVTGDPNLLKQVWFNLLSNAVKFTMNNKERCIEVGGYRNGSENIYYVKDNGVGFDPEHGHKIFDLFQRLHKAEEYSGTGVGLAIVQRVVQRHGGRVWAEGDINRGAAFYFSLPPGCSETGIEPVE